MLKFISKSLVYCFIELKNFYNMGMSASEDHTIYLIIIITNSLSLCGSLFILAIFASSASVRSYAFKLVFYMTIADTIRAAGYIIPTSTNSLCITQAVLTNFGALSGVLWTSIIAFSIYAVVVLELENIQSYEKFTVIIGYILPFCITLLPFTTDSYGEAEGWCWIKLDGYEILWRMGTFYIIVFAVIVFNGVMYYKVHQELNIDIGYLRGSTHDISEKKNVHTRFGFYPLIIFICYMPVLIKRILETASDDNFFALTIIAAISMSIIGILNAIAYGITDSVKELLCKPFNRSSSYSTNRTAANDALINEVTEEFSLTDD